MSRKLFAVLALALATAAFPKGANAEWVYPWTLSTLPTTGNDGSQMTFGPYNQKAYGQTFQLQDTSTLYTNISDFSFWLKRPASDTQNTDNNPEVPMYYKGYLAEWNSTTNTIGTALYASQQRELAIGDTWTEAKFDIFTDKGANIALNYPNATYVAFISTLDQATGNELNSQSAAGGMRIKTADSYSGGAFQYTQGPPNSPANFSALSTNAWLSTTGQDAAFVANFSNDQNVPSPGTPEPASLALIGMGLLAPGLRRRRAAKNARAA